MTSPKKYTNEHLLVYASTYSKNNPYYSKKYQRIYNF